MRIHDRLALTRTASAVAVRAKADEFATSIGPIAQDLRDQGFSLNKIAIALTDKGIRTARGGRWSATTVRNLLARQTAA